jgi:hypothetical protein
MRDITSSYTSEKKKKSSLWARIFSRPVSFIFTYLFINLGFTANAVSVLSMVEVLVACLFIMLGGKLLPWGVGLYVMWHVLDCCDGNIARVTKKSSYAGEFFDAVSGYTAPAFIFLSVGVAAFKTTVVPADYSYWFIVIGALASISDILGRIIYQKYVVTEYRLGLIGKEGDIDQERSSGFIHIVDVVMKNMTYSCIFMPLIILALIFNHFDILISVFACYNFLFLIASAVFFVYKATCLNERVDRKF